MPYTWSHHAASDRLPERSSLSKEKVEYMLNQRRYVVCREHWGQRQDRHLLWDPRGHLIDVPVTADGVIPTILPVTYGSGYAEWQCAQAEHAWRGEEYFRDSCDFSQKVISWVEVVLTREWKNPAHWDSTRFYTNHADTLTLFFWPMRDPTIAQTGDDGVLALFCERTFRETMRIVIQDWSPFFQDIMPENNTPVVHIKKIGAHRIVPIEFFLAL